MCNVSFDTDSNERQRGKGFVTAEGINFASNTTHSIQSIQTYKKSIMNRIRSSITSKCKNGSSLFVFRWLQHVQKEMNFKEDERNVNLTLSVYNVSLLGNQERLKDLSVLLPLFRESSKSPAKIKHGLDIIEIAVDEVNKEQAPIVAFDQPLYTIAK